MYDVLIIGAGAAGITIARKLGAAGIRTALVEGGEYDLTTASQNLYQADVIGHPYTLTGTRLRQLGGSTNHWGGFVCAMDADTFEARDDLHEPYPGWPISKTDIDPYFYEGINILDLAQDVAWEPTRNPFDRFDGAMRESGFKELYWNQSTPTRFRDKYYDELMGYESLDLLMNHSLVEFVISDGGRVEAAVLVSIDGQTRTEIHARRFVLATGAIENARLLMIHNAHHNKQYGNASGMLGKYFMEHPELDGAQFVMTDPAYQHRVNNHAFRFFRLQREIQLREHLPAAILRMYFTHQSESDEIISQLESVTRLRRAQHWRAGYVMMSWEQMPTQDNHIELDWGDLDALNMPRAVLHWRLKAEDYRAPRYLLDQFAQVMLAHNFGRVRLFDWILDEDARPDPLWAKHHIGTTRMASNPQHGVVDTDGRLFGTQNLYLMGSSIFPTTGYENPTLPIVQLSLRMADTLIAEIQT